MIKTILTVIMVMVMFAVMMITMSGCSAEDKWDITRDYERDLQALCGEYHGTKNDTYRECVSTNLIDGLVENINKQYNQ